MSIKRYDLCHIGSGIHTMLIDSDGEFVKHEDYAALEQKLAESQREFRAADETIDNLQMQLNAEREEKLAQGVDMLADHLSGMNISASETSVREFAAKLRQGGAK